MEINTQFECDDTVYFMEDNKVVSWIVKKIFVECELIYYTWYRTECTTKYDIIRKTWNWPKTYSFQEWLIYESKEELLKSL